MWKGNDVWPLHIEILYGGFSLPIWCANKWHCNNSMCLIIAYGVKWGMLKKLLATILNCLFVYN